MRSALPPDSETEWTPGLPYPLDNALLSRLASQFPERGDLARLAAIAQWGATICWLTSAPDDPYLPRYLPAAASFNLGVALFDSAMDRNSAYRESLVADLHPSRLAELLYAPAATKLEAKDNRNVDIVALFDCAISTAGSRWRRDRRHLELVNSLLETMYESEVGASSDPFSAKQLPVLFLGAIATREPAHLELHRRLGQFLGAWDDWLDQDEDIIHRQPNTFLGAPDAMRGLGAVPFYGRATYRAVGGLWTIHAVTDCLLRLLGDVLDAAEGTPPFVQRRIDGFLGRLLR